MAEACVKCGRTKEVALDGAPTKNCYLCIGEETDLLGTLESIELSGLRPATQDHKCCLCDRHIVEGSDTVKSDFGHICGPCIGFFQKNMGTALPTLLRERKAWIVKSSLVINGPFTDQRILNGIGAREFSSLDEVCAPRSFWKYIRDTETFSDAVQQSSVKDFREDNTVDITKSMTGSHYGTDPGLGHDTDVIEVSHKEIAGKRKREMPSIGKPAVLFLLGIILLAGVFEGFRQYQQMPQVEEFSEQAARAALHKAYAKGDWAGYEREAQNLTLNGFSLTPQEKIDLAMVQIEQGDLFSARNALQDFEVVSQKINYALLKAKIHFIDRNYEEATEILEKVLESGKADERVKINLAYMYALGDRVKLALDTLPRLVGFEEYNSSLALASLFIETKTRFERDIVSLEKAFELYKTNYDVTFSLDVLKGALYQKNGFSAKALNSFAKALNRHPESEAMFKHNLYLLPVHDRYRMQRMVMNSLEGDNDSIRLSVIGDLYYRSGNKYKAKDFFKRAYEKNPGNPLLELWREYLEKGNAVQIPVQIDPLFLTTSSPLKMMLVSERCIKQGRLDCANKLVQKLTSIDSNDTITQYQRFKIIEKQGDRTKTVDVFKKILGRAPRFIPILEKEDIYL